MRHSGSDQNIYIGSEDDNEEKLSDRSEEDDNESDFSNSYAEDQQENLPSSLNTNLWPQSYRQSIDLYSNVPSPNIGFMSTPTLSRLGSSFFSSSLRRHTPEILSSLVKPLLPTVGDEQQKKRSSQSLLSPLPSRRHSIIKSGSDYKQSKVSHELPVSRQCSFGQAVLNDFGRHHRSW